MTHTAPIDEPESITLARLNGLPYFWRENGSGPPLLLLHGSLAHSGWFRWMMPRLARSYRVIAPDLRGHGRSGHSDDYGWDENAADLEALVDRLVGDQPFYLAGHCSGAYIGMVMAQRGRRAPAAIAALEILPRLSPEEQAVNDAAARRPERSYATLDHAAEVYARSLHTPLGRTRALLAEIYRQDESGAWFSPTDRRVIATPPACTNELASELLCPMLLVRGVETRNLSRVRMLMIASELRDGGFVEIPGAGHHVMLDAPDETSVILEQFFGRVNARASRPATCLRVKGR